jgi:hypothetical protein
MGNGELEHDIKHVAAVVVGAGRTRQRGDTGQESSRAGAKALDRVAWGANKSDGLSYSSRLHSSSRLAWYY